MENMIWYCLLSFLFVFECSALNLEAYKMYDFATWCHPEGGKNVIKLKTGTAIFTLDEKNPVTANILRRRDISCHIELETYSTSYGFHIFFDEMELDNKDESVLDTHKPSTCQDYVQFGRDVLYFTTSKSRKYCGYRERLFYHNASHADYARASRQGSRLYIESSDSEMDVWLLVKKSKNRSRTAKRNLRLIVTVFKKGCPSNDMYWRKCDNTNYCVRKGHFCDNYANCGWPDGERATDETKKLCAEIWRKNSETAGQGTTTISPTNMTIIIIVGIAVGAVVIVLIICFVRFIQAIRVNAIKTNEDENSSTPSYSDSSSTRTNRRIRPEGGVTTARTRPPASANGRNLSSRERQRLTSIEEDLTPSLLRHTDPGEGLPSAPPSYEEVVQVPYVPAAPIDDQSQPPPYSST